MERQNYKAYAAGYAGMYNGAESMASAEEVFCFALGISDRQNDREIKSFKQVKDTVVSNFKEE